MRVNNVALSHVVRLAKKGSFFFPSFFLPKSKQHEIAHVVMLSSRLQSDSYSPLMLLLVIVNNMRIRLCHLNLKGPRNFHEYFLLHFGYLTSTNLMYFKPMLPTRTLSKRRHSICYGLPINLIYTYLA